MGGGVVGARVIYFGAGDLISGGVVVCSGREAPSRADLFTYNQEVRTSPELLFTYLLFCLCTGRSRGGDPVYWSTGEHKPAEVGLVGLFIYPGPSLLPSRANTCLQSTRTSGRPSGSALFALFVVDSVNRLGCFLCLPKCWNPPPIHPSPFSTATKTHFKEKSISRLFTHYQGNITA